MRAVGSCLALLASVSLVSATTPAFAQDNAPPGSAAAPAALDAKENKEAAKEAPKHEQTAVPLDGKTTVHIQVPQTVTLEKRSGAQAAWEHVCNSPCDEKLSVNDEYRIVGDGLSPSKPFMLDAKGENVTLDVQPGLHKKHVTGMWVLGGGAVLAVTGAVIVIAGASSSNTFQADGQTHLSNTNWITAGTVLILGGIVAAITGGAWALDNAHTGVNGGVAAPPAEKKGPNGVNVQLSASRQPTYREADKVPQPASFVVPVLRGTF